MGAPPQAIPQASRRSQDASLPKHPASMSQSAQSQGVPVDIGSNATSRAGKTSFSPYNRYNSCGKVFFCLSMFVTPCFTKEIVGRLLQPEGAGLEKIEYFCS